MASASRAGYSRTTGTGAGAPLWRGFANLPGGKVKSKAGFPNRRQALAWAVDHEREAARLAALPPEPAAVPTVAEWWDTVRAEGWWPTSELNRSQRDRDLSLYVLHRWGGVPLDRVTGPDVSAWLLRLTTAPTGEDRATGTYRSRPGSEPRQRPVLPVSVGTARRVRASFRRLVQIAVDRGVVLGNPVGSSAVPDAAARAPRWVLAEDALAAARLMPPRLVAPTVLAVLTGLRLGELLALDQESWLPGADEINVNRVIIEPSSGVFAWRPVTKGLKDRTVPLVPAAAAILAEHVQAYPPVRVRLRQAADERRRAGADVRPVLYFTDDQGRPWKRAAVGAAWDRAQKQAGNPTRTSFHGLRHTYASYLLTAGEPIAVVASLLGHSATRTSELYAHLTNSRYVSARRSLESLAQVLQPPLPEPVREGLPPAAF